MASQLHGGASTSSNPQTSPMEDSINKGIKRRLSTDESTLPAAKRSKTTADNDDAQGLSDLLSRIPTSLVLCQLASVGDIVGIKHLLSVTNADINSPDYDGRTTLHLASDEGHLELVEFLVTNGANVHATDRWGQTPLHCAFMHDHHVIASFLQSHGAKFRTTDASVSQLPNAAPATSHQMMWREKLKWHFDQITQHPSGSDKVSVEDLKAKLRKFGLNPEKNKQLRLEIEEISSGSGFISFESFSNAVMRPGPETLVEKALLNRLAILDWSAFCDELKSLYHQVAANKAGHVATYIPELGSVDPELFGVSVCTVDGQVWSYGDSEVMFPIQSSGKPVLYSAAIEEYGDEYVHKYVGREPSGVSFNAFTLNSEDKPHNACINAGAIIISALYHPDCNPSQRFKLFSNKLADMIGGERPGFGQAVYLSEKDTAHTNFALAHFMAAKSSFPSTVTIEEALDFYFQMCSTELNCRQMATLAATYANNGVSPISGHRLLKPESVKRTVQMLFSCGMYDFSGEWACTVGLPAKSGVSGIIFLVVPGVLGMAIFAPPLDRYGNSVKGVEFAAALAAKHHLGMFDVVYRQGDYATFKTTQNRPQNN